MAGSSSIISCASNSDTGTARYIKLGLEDTILDGDDTVGVNKANPNPMNDRETALLNNRLAKIKQEVSIILNSPGKSIDRKPKLENLYKSQKNINSWLQEK